MSDNKQVELPILKVRHWDGKVWPDKRISLVDSDKGFSLMISARYAYPDEVEGAIQEIARRCNEYKQLQARVKELEELASKQRDLEAQLQGEINCLEAESAELRSRGAVYFGLQKDSGYLLVDQDSGQLEIYETLQSAQLAKSLGQTIVRIRACKDDEGEA